MNQEENEERDQREGRYRESQDDVRIIRKELNKLTAAVGDLRNLVETAFKGNDLGSPGILKRIDNIEKMAGSLNDQFDDLKRDTKTEILELGVKADKRINLLLLIGVFGGTFLGILLKWVFDNIFTKK